MFNQLNNNFGGVSFRVNEGKIEWKEQGADTFNPFSKSGGEYLFYGKIENVTSGYLALQAIGSNCEQISSTEVKVLRDATITLVGHGNYVHGVAGNYGSIYINGVKVSDVSALWGNSSKVIYEYSFSVNKNDIIKIFDTSGNQYSVSMYLYAVCK